MPSSLRIAYFAHAIRSDWNNGNAHFLRGLLRALGKIDGVHVTAYEIAHSWSLENLYLEPNGARSLKQFEEVYPDLNLHQYLESDSQETWEERLNGIDIVIVHEWNSPEFVARLLVLRSTLHFRMLFHDTHHRASSSPHEMERFSLTAFDGILAFGQALQEIYQTRFGIRRVWPLHEAADVSVFFPQPDVERENAIVWVGNWGEGERSGEISEYLLNPAKALSEHANATIYGVRYPETGLDSLTAAGVHYGGYLPNLQAPQVYARAKATVHIPRQQYSGAMRGIPTIRVFEALACGIPLVSAPWEDTENLFRPGDFLWASSKTEMTNQLKRLLSDPAAAQAQAMRGRETVLAHHTCDHRARELVTICEEVLQ